MVRVTGVPVPLDSVDRVSSPAVQRGGEHIVALVGIPGVGRCVGGPAPVLRPDSRQASGSHRLGRSLHGMGVGQVQVELVQFQAIGSRSMRRTRDALGRWADLVSVSRIASSGDEAA